MKQPTLTQQGYRGRALLLKLLELPPEGMEVLLGILNLGWALVLWIGRPFPTAPGFRLMLQLGHYLGDPFGADPHIVWAFPLLVVGVFVAFAVLNGAGMDVRIVCATLSLAIWTFIAIAIIGANVRSTGTIIYSLIVLSQFWVLIRLRLARIGAK